MKTIRATWYEAWMKKGYGTKLADHYNNQREAKKAIKEAVAKEKSFGYNPSEYILMIVDVIVTYDDDGETISKTMTYARA